MCIALLSMLRNARTCKSINLSPRHGECSYILIGQVERGDMIGYAHVFVANRLVLRTTPNHVSLLPLSSHKGTMTKAKMKRAAVCLEFAFGL